MGIDDPCACPLYLPQILGPRLVVALNADIAKWLTTPQKPVLSSMQILLQNMTFPLEEYSLKTNSNFEEVIARVLGGGGTLILPSVQCTESTVSRLCAGAMTAGLAIKNVNLYISRACQSGLGWHVDPHDVLALQISGMKRWKLNIESDLLSPTEVVTKAGDALSIPIGNAHFTETDDSNVSVHAAVNFGNAISSDTTAIEIFRSAMMELEYE